MNETPKLVVVIAGSHLAFINYCHEQDLEPLKCKFVYSLHDIAGYSPDRIDLRLGFEAYKTVAYQHAVSRGWLSQLVSHAVECKERNQWSQTYVSRDENRNPVAFEFRCLYHGANFWLEVPKPLVSRISED